MAEKRHAATTCACVTCHAAIYLGIRLATPVHAAHYAALWRREKAILKALPSAEAGTARALLQKYHLCNLAVRCSLPICLLPR